MSFDIVWLLVAVAGVAFLLFFGMNPLTPNFLEIASFVIVAGIFALIFATRDLLLIAVLLIIVARVVMTKRPAKHEYDVDSAAYGNLK